MVDVEDMIEDLAEARNKSVEVDDKSLAELQNKFDPIKNAIGGMPFYDSLKAELVDKVMSFTRSLGSNPNVAGKDNNLWDVLLMTVLLNTN